MIVLWNWVPVLYAVLIIVICIELWTIEKHRRRSKKAAEAIGIMNRLVARAEEALKEELAEWRDRREYLEGILRENQELRKEKVAYEAAKSNIRKEDTASAERNTESTTPGIR